MGWSVFVTKKCKKNKFVWVVRCCCVDIHSLRDLCHLCAVESVSDILQNSSLVPSVVNAPCIPVDSCTCTGEGGHCGTGPGSGRGLRSTGCISQTQMHPLDLRENTLTLFILLLCCLTSLVLICWSPTGALHPCRVKNSWISSRSPLQHQLAPHSSWCG